MSNYITFAIFILCIPLHSFASDVSSSDLNEEIVPLKKNVAKLHRSKNNIFRSVVKLYAHATEEVKVTQSDFTYIEWKVLAKNKI